MSSYIVSGLALAGCLALAVAPSFAEDHPHPPEGRDKATCLPPAKQDLLASPEMCFGTIPA